MSHFTSVKTKIKDLTCLIRTIKELGYTFTQAKVEQQVFVRGYAGQKIECELSIHASRTYDIGVKVSADGSCEFVADWWGVESTRGVSEEEFMRQVTQRYSYHKVMEEVKKRGYTIEEEEVDEEQQIHVRIRSWS